jgi:hypothetical protein
MSSLTPNYSSQPLFGLGAGMLAATVYYIFAVNQQEIQMVDRLTWSFRNPLEEKIIVFLIIGSGLLAGLFLGLLTEWRVGLFVGTFTILGAGLIFMVLFGSNPESIETTTWPGQRLRFTLLNAVFIATILALITQPLVYFVTLPVADFNYSLIYSLGASIAMGGLAGAVFGGTYLIKHYALRFVLSQFNVLPWRLFSFLDSAVKLIFLRRVGGNYIFVHRLLMEHFAEMEIQPEKPGA